MSNSEQREGHSMNAQAGIDMCRKGDWRRGVELLRSVAASEDGGEMPGLFYSYLGYGVARFEHRYREGLRLCRHAVKKEFYHPENYLNLARTHLLTGDRRGAIRAIRDGLRIDSSNKELREYQRELGVRRQPVLPFLSRDNVFNRILGKIRHTLKSSGQAA